MPVGALGAPAPLTTVHLWRTVGEGLSFRSGEVGNSTVKYFIFPNGMELSECAGYAALPPLTMVWLSLAAATVLGGDPQFGRTRVSEDIVMRME